MDVVRMLEDSSTMILLSETYKSYIDGKGKDRISKIIYEKIK